ncbi:LysR family transcriptional regulator [Pseudomonas syringae]|uniref:LysR family transcriptional regulator n=1 Tax=Pseudomonas syringae pv. aceris TaxID=199198 RepID=A0A0L8IPS4_PSESX|nr:LysR family transcriptional regulator [Pseudomonas syringae]EGH71550.1 LysR family transcriptional regulator [Pseudomonas syringae pv. aceris str. M302273]KOG03487.1 LysR family transcriptional regulator [Pseudomonas syringae pv. aceris]KPW09216.1 LysR family transcriptional regulator [Pseudomonas syringae pv. aceris]
MNLLDSRHTDEISALLAIASERSFVAAARLLQRHPTVISKRLAAIEARLGVRLIERTTRQVRLTDAGARLVDRLRAATGLITEAEQEATLGAAEIRGVLRLAMPAAMGRLWLSPLLPEFLFAHPQLSVEVDYSERFVDIIAEGIDAAIRIGELNDSRLVAKKLGDHRRILCASPAYLQRWGMPHRPGDLRDHNCLGFTGLASFPEWRLSDGERLETIVIGQGCLSSNDSEALLVAAKAGVGILGAGEWLMSRDIGAGRLIQLLPDWTLDPQGGIYLIRPSAKFTPAATLAFKTWIESKFAQGTPWTKP